MELRRVENKLLQDADDVVIYLTHTATGNVRQCDARPAAQAIISGGFRQSSKEEVAAYRKAQEEEAQRLSARNEARQSGRLLPPKKPTTKKGE